jgi:hypothetical protein
MSAKKRASYNGTPARGDSAWLMKEFLDIVFPDGGKAFTGTMAEWPNKHKSGLPGVCSAAVVSQPSILPRLVGHPRR